MITLLFGAGASVAFSEHFSTAAVTKAIRDKEQWETLINRINREVRLSRKLIMRVRRKVLNVTRKETNFECIIEVFDRVCGYFADSAPNKNLFNKVIRVIRRFCPLTINAGIVQNSYHIIPFLVREIVAQQLIRAHETEKYKWGAKGLVQLQHEFIKSLKAKTEDDYVSLISLNYDTILTQSIGQVMGLNSMPDLGFETGFPKDNGMFDYQRLVSAPLSIVYPHGSLSFHRLENYRIKYYANITQAEDCRLDGLKKCFPNRTAVGSLRDFGIDYNSFMVTGKTKEMSMSCEPWGLLYIKAIGDLARKNQCIITIGYRFADDHYNSAIKHAFLSSNARGLLVIDYKKEALIYQEVLQGALYQLFHKHNLVFKDSEIRKSIDVINRDGHGLLFNRIYYYKDGYESFLKNYASVINSFYAVI